MRTYKIPVIKFKRSGKYYDDMIHETQKEWTHEIIDEIENLISKGVYSDDYLYVITTDFDGQLPHPNLYPAIIGVK